MDLCKLLKTFLSGPYQKMCSFSISIISLFYVCVHAMACQWTAFGNSFSPALCWRRVCGFSSVFLSLAVLYASRQLCLCPPPCYRKAEAADRCHHMWCLTWDLGNHFRSSDSHGSVTILPTPQSHIKEGLPQQHKQAEKSESPYHDRKGDWLERKGSQYSHGFSPPLWVLISLPLPT